MKQSAGLLLFQRNPGLEVFLVHPGGPFWSKKDAGVWTIPKGEYTSEEDPLTAAQREFAEETGLEIRGHFIPLGTVRQSGGKVVTAWAIESSIDTSRVRSNTFTMEWPPRSGKQVEFPEIDRWEWFSLEDAMKKILPAQATFLLRLADHLK